MFSQNVSIDDTLFVNTTMVSLENLNSKKQNANLNIKMIALKYFNKFREHNKKVIEKLNSIYHTCYKAIKIKSENSTDAGNI